MFLKKLYVEKSKKYLIKVYRINRNRLDLLISKMFFKRLKNINL